MPAPLSPPHRSTAHLRPSPLRRPRRRGARTPLPGVARQSGAPRGPHLTRRSALARSPVPATPHTTAKPRRYPPASAVRVLSVPFVPCLSLAPLTVLDLTINVCLTHTNV